MEQNYTMMEIEALAMVYTFHTFRNYLFNNNFIFYIDHMELTYLVNKP
jgi:hypothetical protein